MAADEKSGGLNSIVPILERDHDFPLELLHGLIKDNLMTVATYELLVDKHWITQELYDKIRHRTGSAGASGPRPRAGTRPRREIRIFITPHRSHQYMRNLVRAHKPVQARHSTGADEKSGVGRTGLFGWIVTKNSSSTISRTERKMILPGDGIRSPQI